MEYGLRVQEKDLKVDSVECLNPCFNGIWSARSGGFIRQNQLENRLNPCFNGIWSASVKAVVNGVERSFVLILVLMEYGLRGPC